MGADYSIADLVRAGLRGFGSELFKALPGKVTAYDPVTNTAVVKPAVKVPLYSEEGKRTFEELPEIPFVPVMWPRAGGYLFTAPMEEGDSVLLVFADVSLAEWRTSGDVPSEPRDARRHGAGWPVAIPGLFSDSDNAFSPADALERAAGAAILGEDGGTEQIILGGTLPGVRVGKLAVSPVALAVPLLAQVALTAASGTAGAASSTSIIAALNAIQAALAALVAVPANSGAAAAVTASATAITTASAAATAGATAATAAATGAAVAAGAVPSTLLKAI